MNIVIKAFGRDCCHCRPDTTWERENKDFYSPDCVNEIYWTPVVFARISKAGKCIGRKFASRYWDSGNFGVLLYCNASGTMNSAEISCIDHTSLLPMPLYNPMVLENENNQVNIEVSGILTQTFRSNSGIETINILEEAICKASELTSLRIGDFIAVELEDKRLLTRREDGNATIKAFYCENEIISQSIIF